MATGIIHQNVVITAMYRSHDFSSELPSAANHEIKMIFVEIYAPQ